MTAAGAVEAPVTPERELRRHFALPEEDVENLNSSGLRWETVRCTDRAQQVDWVIILDVPVPAGLEARDAPHQPLPTVDMAIRVTGYPDAALDMVYVYPPLARASRNPIGGLTELTIDARAFQQWSRHYRYDVNTNCLFSHFCTACTWLEKAASI